MRKLFFIVIAAAVAASIGACTVKRGAPPSLLPRAAEKIDPRVPVEAPINSRPVDATLASKLAAFVSQAHGGDAAFAPALAKAEQLAAAAGAAHSDGWTVAQEALSAAIAARAPTARALVDIDALGADKLQAQQGLSPADLEAIRSAGSEVGTIDQRQADAVAAIQRRLGD
jgi:hypothetical protein